MLSLPSAWSGSTGSLLRLGIRGHFRLGLPSLISQSLGFQISSLPIVVSLDQSRVAFPEKDRAKLSPDRGHVPMLAHDVGRIGLRTNEFEAQNLCRDRFSRAMV